MALLSIMTGALLSANTSRQMARVQSAVKSRMDGHAGVLDSEIKLDSARGGDTKKKQEELDELQKKASELAETTINTLTTASEDLKKAAKEDQEVQRAEKAAEKKKAEKAAEKKKAEKEVAEERIEKAAETSATETTEATEGVRVVATEGTTGEHVSIDIVSEGVTVNTGTVSVTTGNNVDVKA
jgi:membrane protein involved in colicin uptake